jgi:hypothetical protein
MAKPATGQLRRFVPVPSPSARGTDQTLSILIGASSEWLVLTGDHRRFLSR